MHKYFNHFYSTYFIQNDGNDSNDYDEVQKCKFPLFKTIRAKQPLLQINSQFASVQNSSLGAPVERYDRPTSNDITYRRLFKQHTCKVYCRTDWPTDDQTDRQIDSPSKQYLPA